MVPGEATSESTGAPDTGEDRANQYRLRDQIGTILRVANQNAVDVFNDVIVEEFGEPIVTTTQFAVLSTLWRCGSLSHSELAARVVLDMPTLHSVLKRLDRKGLIGTEIDALDKRKRIVSLTEAGNALAYKLRSIGTMISDRILNPLDSDQRHLFLELLRTFNASRRDLPRH